MPGSCRLYLYYTKPPSLVLVLHVLHHASKSCISTTTLCL